MSLNVNVLLEMLQINLLILRLRSHVNLVIVVFKIALRPCILLQIALF